MSFSNVIFLFYFIPVFFILFYLLPCRFRNYLLLPAGLFFYAWGAPVFVCFVAGSILVDYFLVRGMAGHENKGKRKIFLFSSLLLNLGLLVYFKYANFFLENFNWILLKTGSGPMEWTKILLPVGISFITFQKISYSMDCYRRTYPPARNLWDYATYVMMFPQILSGPITRFHQVSGTLQQPVPVVMDDRLGGLFRFSIGLAKKVLVADLIAGGVGDIFALHPADLNTPVAWLGALGFTFQLYFDFSGYSDMAIGLARMMGFRLPENFNNPYLSGSITEFWKRWHITLSSWLRDYLFLPIAYSVSRKMKKDKYFDIRSDKIIYLIATTITFLLCGFWHGAGWTFIAWGLYQGLFLIADRLFLLKILKKTGRIISIPFTFMVSMAGWVIFHSANLGDAGTYLLRMVAFDFHPSSFYAGKQFIIMIAIAFLFSFFALPSRGEKLQASVFGQQLSFAGTIAMWGISAGLLFLSISFIVSSGFNPFIYFRF